ncbi:receptor-type tyrosine-protein phosphatase beta-like [Branchiostoma floridae]|uniref:Receptor-type tyrosine-protein phosphatase beta-like n=1 Tax=Branchiostoma floridae TaxID=7739 RepID=A0A9J7LYK7_BRAFL|nr:receptor-type tyrosine-protein phosphatase beta-like [Branchiostoma floridae]
MGSSLEIPTVTGLCVTSYGTTSISISWTAVTGWWPLSDPEVRVHISASGPNETWKKSDDLLGGTSTKRFENLRPASNYTIRVAVLGWGGTEGKRTSILCATRPRPITSISVTEQTTSTIKVKWAAAIDNNVTYLAQITGHDPIPVDKDLAFVFKELDPGTSYDVSVIVKRTFEDGREVESRPCKTTASTCPARPEGFHVNSCSPYSITVAWQPPVGNIDCYKVDIWCKDQTKSRSDNQKPEQSQTKGKDSIECVFDSLSTNPGSLHRITISSHFQDLSSEMVEITQRTKVCSPDLKLCEKTETSITISWEHVKGEKEKYVLSLSPSEGESDVEIPCHENRLQHMFQNLVPGKEYKVSAITIYEDAECERCVLIVRTTVPPPQNITVIKESITAHSFMVRWDKVVGEISGYFVRYSSQSHCQYEPFLIAPEHQQVELTDLIPGTTYSVSVSSKSGDDESTSDKIIQSTKVLPIIESDHSEGDWDDYEIEAENKETKEREIIVWTSKESKEHEQLIPNLVPGSWYDISIRSVRGDQKSTPSTVRFRTLPNAPVDVEITTKGHEVTIGWKHPYGKNDGYVVKLSSLSETLYTIHGVTVSGDGKSEETVLTVRTAVGEPKNPAVEATLTALKLQWDPADGEVDEYHVYLEPKDDPSSTAPVVVPKNCNTCHQFNELVPGRLYKMTIVTIREDVESNECVVTEQTLVGQPKNVQLEQSGDGALRLTWEDADGDKDGEVHQYGISISHGNEVSRREISASSHEYLFENLTPGRLYTISMWTYVGDLGSTSIPRSIQERTLVASAKAVRVSDCTHSSISFTWDDAEGDVDNYEYCAMHREVCVKTNVTELSDQRPVQVDDLTGGRLYSLVVVAVSGDRKSQPTTTTHRTKVHKPEGLRIFNVKNQQVTITWEQAQGDKDKYTAAIFDTTLEDRAPNCIGDVSASAFALEYRFSALVPGREYEIAIRTNSGGETSEPETRLIRTLPLRPVNVRTSTVDSGIIVKWLEPSGDKDEYSLEICPNENLQSPVLISSGNETSHTFTGVTLGKLYDIKISTRSKDVESAKVVRQQRMTVGPPSLVPPQPFETSLKVIWKHAEGVKDRYHIKIWEEGGSTYVREDVRNADEDLEMTFESLVSGRLYRVEVTTESGGEFSECVHETVRTKIRPPTEIIIADNDVKENSIRITWPEPYCDKDRYHVSIAPKYGVENPVDVVERGQPLEYTFQKLTSGRKYQLSVWTDSGGDKSYPVTTMKRTTVSSIEQISVRERTESTLTITWHDAKGEKSSYIASIREMNCEMSLQNPLNIPTNSRSLPYSRTFTTLIPGRMYEVSVVTVSGEMESLPRNMPFRTIVSPPRNVKIPQDSVTEHSMDVVWEDARGDWESYEHNISPNEGFARHIGKESLDGAVVYRSTFENLVAGKIYRIGMFTRNKEADSEVVLLEGKRTKVAAVDENSIVFTNVSENAVTLEWAQAAGEKDIYRVTIHPSSDDTAVVKSPSAEIKADDELLHTFSDLTPGQKYNISIVTFKENDKSSEATKTIHTKPNKPEGFRVETFAESIAVSWDSPVGVQDEYMVEIRKVAEDPEWFIKATFAEKTGPPNDEGAGITDESTETRPWQSFKYTFREKGTIKARTKYKISAQTRSGEKQSGGQFSHVVSVEERTKPHPPRDPRLVKEGIESVTFSWAPPIDEEQKRDIYRYRYIVKYKGPGEEGEREHDCQYNNSAKIEHLRDNTEYDFFVISVVETTTEDGKQERVYSERCRFTFKTESRSTKIVRKFSKKMNQALFIVICGGAFVITLFTFLGVFIHNCVRPFDQNEVDSAIEIPSTNVTNTTNLNNISSVKPTSSSVQSYNSGIECFFEKAGEQFWYFVFSTAVPAICLLAILLWKVVKRVRKSMTRATNGEIRRLLEESAIEMTDIYSDEDKPRLEYGITTTRQRWLFDSS